MPPDCTPDARPAVTCAGMADRIPLRAERDHFSGTKSFSTRLASSFFNLALPLKRPQPPGLKYLHSIVRRLPLIEVAALVPWRRHTSAAIPASRSVTIAMIHCTPNPPPLHVRLTCVGLYLLAAAYKGVRQSRRDESRGGAR